MKKVLFVLAIVALTACDGATTAETAPVVTDSTAVQDSVLVDTLKEIK